MAESGSRFMVYDVVTQRTHAYDTAEPLDAPQTHATWMDGGRLQYVRDGQLVVADYDHMNRQMLMPALPLYPVAFSANYNAVFSLVAAGDGAQLTQTSLLAAP